MNSNAITATEDEMLRTDLGNPKAFVLRCPDCDDRQVSEKRPGNKDRVCSTCNRLQGVRPVAVGSPP